MNSVFGGTLTKCHAPFLPRSQHELFMYRDIKVVSCCAYNYCSAVLHCKNVSLNVLWRSIPLPTLYDEYCHATTNETLDTSRDKEWDKYCQPLIKAHRKTTFRTKVGSQSEHEKTGRRLRQKFNHQWERFFLEFFVPCFPLEKYGILRILGLTKINNSSRWHRPTWHKKLHQGINFEPTGVKSK